MRELAIVHTGLADPALLLGGALAALIIFGIAVVSEAVALVVLCWAPPLRAVRDAAIVNLASILAAVALAAAFAQTLSFGSAPWALLLGAWALSVAIEGALLAWLGGRSRPRRRAWAIALAINTMSYTLLAAAALALSAV